MLERGIISKGDRGSPEDSDDNPPPNNGLNRIDDIISETEESFEYSNIEKMSKALKAHGEIYLSPASSYTLTLGNYENESHSSTKRLEFDGEELTLVDETFEGDIEIGSGIENRPIYNCSGAYSLDG